MKNSKRNHFLVILLIAFIAVFLLQYMMTRVKMEKRDIVAVVLPKNQEMADCRVMDGIRDYAMYHDMLLDVWYKESISSEELETLILEEEKNHAIGVLLVYPENYMNRDAEVIYNFDHVLAITDTMKEFFTHTATFEESSECIYSIPVPVQVIEQLTADSNQVIYIKNTYKLGYCTMEMMKQYARSKRMDDICVPYIRVDGATIADGEINALLTE